jgi:C-terminal processing protease CtpA/Prc
MKNYFVILFIFLAILSFGQNIENSDKKSITSEFNNSSKISEELLHKIGEKNLNELGLIWGFLKYYHPNVSSGKYNWDDELFRILPKISDISPQQKDKILTDWIKSFGDFKTKEYPKLKNIKMKADLDWITSSGFSKELTELLLKVKKADRKSSNYYVALLQSGNPGFKNENPYSTMVSPDAGFRLLSLFRYWNIIQYYFPYKYAIGEDWKKVLIEFIPKFISADDGTKYSLTCLELFTHINDSHAGLHNNVTFHYFGERLLPLEIVFVGNKAVVKNYYDENLGKETGIKIGDLILEVNGKSVEKMMEEHIKYLPASNQSVKLRDLASVLLNSNELTVDIKYSSNGVEKTINLPTYRANSINYTQKRPEPFKMINNDIAYLHLEKLKSENLPEIFEKIKNTKGLVIDIRTYPTDFLAFKLGKYLMQKPEAFVDFTVTNPSTPGDFSFVKLESVGNNNKDYYKGKVAILVNETTQSSAEYHTMAFRKAPKAKVFGSQTSGADGDVSYVSLPGKIQTTFTGIGVYNPDRSETQRIGIIPDVEIKPTIEGIKNNKDEVLEKAIEWIKN